MILIVLVIIGVLAVIHSYKKDALWPQVLATVSFILAFVLLMVGLALLRSHIPTSQPVTKTETYQLVPQINDEDLVTLTSDKAVVYVKDSNGLLEPMNLYRYELRNVPEKNGTLEILSSSSAGWTDFIVVPWKNSSAKSAVIYVDRDNVRILGLDA